MRVLIYSESEKAKTICAEQREAGHHTSLRNPQYFVAKDTEPADEIWCYADNPEVFRAYHAKLVTVRLIDNYGIEPEQFETVEPVTKKRGRTKS